MLTTVAVVMKYRRDLKEVEANTILSFVCISVLSIILQILFPQILLTGMALSLAILMMFFTIQNPECMLDLITGVFNYTALNEYLRVNIAEGRPLWLTAVDVGGLRRINSTLGVLAGNLLLGQIGRYFSENCVRHAIAFRMIGTRFLIISDNEATHRQVLSDVSLRFQQPWSLQGMDIPLSVTLRYSESASRFPTPGDVINLIDHAYTMGAGEDYGTTRPMGQQLLDQSRRLVEVELAVRRALKSGSGFSIVFQPLYSVAAGRFHSAEVLLRLTDPELGPIPPAEFIPVAERTGLIPQIDQLVLDLSCRFLRAHPELDLAGLNHLEINFSAAEFYRDIDQLVDVMLDKLEGLSHKICLEVTETAATSHRELLSAFIDKLAARGICFAIDDFGTGYANITQLAQFPFSIVKLDRTFIVSQQHKDRIILEDLINMFRRIGLTTVLEGVETAEQAQLAIALGIDQIQGFYYSYPLCEADFVALMCSFLPKESQASL